MKSLIGYAGLTPLTHLPSFHILETNAKSRNVGRTLRLLNLKKDLDHPPSDISYPSYLHDRKSQPWRRPLLASYFFGSLHHTRTRRKRGKKYRQTNKISNR